MSPSLHAGQPYRLRLLFGLLLCLLVVLFSTSAKLAAYVHAPAADQIKSMKMPLKSLPSIAEVALEMPVGLPAVLFLALLAAAVSSVRVVMRGEETLPTADRWFFPTLSVRPPPTL